MVENTIQTQQDSSLQKEKTPQKEENIKPLPEKEKEKKEETSPQKTTNLAFWILIFMVAGLKDLLEFIFGLIPVIGSILVWVISFLLGGLLLLLLFLSGNMKKFKLAQSLFVFISQFSDLIPVLNILPLSLATVTLTYLINKNQTIISLAGLGAQKFLLKSLK